jgi:hypothetical protein
VPTSPPRLTEMTVRVARSLITHPDVPHVELPEAVAQTLGVTVRSIDNALRRLDEVGAITWVRKARGGRHRPYWLVTVHDDAPVWDVIADAIDNLDTIGAVR